MPINLGSYGWLASTAIDFGFPILATALGVPAAAPFAIKMVKKVLGLAPSAGPDDVKAAIEADPESAKIALENAQSEVAAKYTYLTRLAEIQGDVAKANTEQVNETIRAEQGKVSWWHWRHLLGYVVGFEILAFPTAAMATILFGKADTVTAIINFSGTLTSILSIGAGLLGFVAFDTTRKVTAAMTGEAPPSIVTSAVKAVTGRKK